MLKHKSWLLFLATIWIFIFAAPPLRSRLLLMWHGGPQTAFSVFSSGYPKNPWPTFAKQNSQSAALQFMSIATQKSRFAGIADKANLYKIDHLIQKYPDTKWLPAMRLRLTLARFSTERVGGELSDPDFSENLKNGKPSPEVSHYIHSLNFNNKDLVDALKICKLAKNREPQNSYYNWIESCLYWMSWQDDKARQALRDGAAKNRWDSHVQDFFKATEDDYRQVVRRPLLALEKVEIIRAVPIFDAVRKYRENVRVITWSAIKDHRAGNNARTLQTLADAHHLMYLAGRGSDYTMDFLVINAAMAITESGAYRPSRKVLLANMGKPKRKMSVEQKQQANLAAFVNLAKSQRRNALAKQIAKEGKARIATWKKQQEQARESTFAQQDNYRYGAFVVAWQSGVVLLLVLLGTLSTWILIASGKYFCLQRLKSDSISKPRTSEIIQGALAIGGIAAAEWAILFLGVITLVLAIDVYVAGIIASVLVTFLSLLLIFILAQNIRNLIQLIRDEHQSERNYLYPLIYLFASATALAALVATWPYFYSWIDDHFPLNVFLRQAFYDAQFPIIRWISDAFNAFTNPTLDIYQAHWRVTFAAIPLIFGGLFCISKILEKQSELAAVEETDNRPRSRSQKITIWIAKRFGLIYVFSLWYLSIQATGNNTVQKFLLLQVILLVTFGLLFVIRTWLHRTHRCASLHYGLQVFKRSLQLCMCVASVGILLMLISQLSVSKSLILEANAQLYGDKPSFVEIKE